MANENQAPAQAAPNPGTKDAIKAELEETKAALAAKEAELEKLKAAQAQTAAVSKEPNAPKAEERVKIFVPRGASNEEPNLFISVNGVNYLLPKGKESEVPAHIAAEYNRIKRAMDRQDRSKAQLLDASKQ